MGKGYEQSIYRGGNTNGRCSALLGRKKMRAKTIAKCLPGLAGIQNCDNVQCRGWCGEIPLQIPRWEPKMAQPLGRATQLCPAKFNKHTRHPGNPTSRNLSHRKAYTCQQDRYIQGCSLKHYLQEWKMEDNLNIHQPRTSYYVQTMAY